MENNGTNLKMKTTDQVDASSKSYFSTWSSYFVPSAKIGTYFLKNPFSMWIFNRDFSLWNFRYLIFNREFWYGNFYNVSFQ